jgi:hypothetical protein
VALARGRYVMVGERKFYFLKWIHVLHSWKCIFDCNGPSVKGKIGVFGPSSPRPFMGRSVC